jgi:hypothetical protein
LLVRRKYMKTEAAVLASQTRLMLSQAQALTSGQGQDWLGNCLNKHGLKPVVQDWLNDPGLRMVEYSILMNFGKMLEQVFSTIAAQSWAKSWRSPCCSGAARAWTM